MLEEIVLWPLEEMFRRRVIAFLVDQELLPRDRAEMLLSWQHSGFSLHCSRRVGIRKSRRPRRLLVTSCATRYDGEDALRAGCRQCPLPLTHEQEAGRQLRGALAQRLHRGGHRSITDKGFQLVRYDGWYSNKARGVRAKTGAAQAEDSAQGHEPDRAPTSAQWRRLIAKIWEADPLTCPDCVADMRILAFIEEDRVIGRILRHLGLLPDASRGPPLQEPVYEPIYNDLPAVEEEDVVYQPF